MSAIPKSIYEAPSSSKLPLRKVILKKEKEKMEENDAWSSLMPSAENEGWESSFDINTYQSQIVDDEEEKNEEEKKKRNKKKKDDEIRMIENLRKEKEKEQKMINKEKEREEKIKNHTTEALFPKNKGSKKRKKVQTNSNQEEEKENEGEEDDAEASKRRSKGNSIGFCNTPFKVFLIFLAALTVFLFQFPYLLSSLDANPSSTPLFTQVSIFDIKDSSHMVEFLEEKNKIMKIASSYPNYIFFDAISVPAHPFTEYEVYVYFKDAESAHIFLISEEYSIFKKKYFKKEATTKNLQN